MADCSRDDIRDLLPDLVHDQLEPEARARVEQHLAGCAECAAELDLLRAMRATAFATPDVDVDRIAAAVLDAMSAHGAPAARDDGGDDGGDDIVVSISAASQRSRGRTLTGAHAASAAHRARPRPARRPIPHHLRIAAAIALVAAGAGGYALTRTGPDSPLLPARHTAVAESGPAPSGTTREMSAQSGAAKAGAPVAAAPMAARDVAVAADSGADAPAPGHGHLILGDAVNELSESDMQALLQSVDDLQAMPDLEPHQLPLLASIVEGAL